MVVIVTFKYLDALLSMKFNPGLIPQVFKSLVYSVKDRIIPLSFLFFVDVVRTALQSYTHML